MCCHQMKGWWKAQSCAEGRMCEDQRDTVPAEQGHIVKYIRLCMMFLVFSSEQNKWCGPILNTLCNSSSPISRTMGWKLLRCKRR